MPYSDYLAQIAALIKKDPSITVREIATELKFADSKSVYYWLEKANVSGINEFKRRILGELGTSPTSPSVDIQGLSHYLVPVPLYSWNTQEENPVEEWYHLHTHSRPQGLFAVRVGTNRYSPWFIQNDILIVSEGSTHSPADWILLKTHQEFLIGKNINGQIVEPNTLQYYPSTLISVGVILHQHRSFLP